MKMPNLVRKGKNKDMKSIIPMALAEGVKTQLVSYFSSIHCVGKILLVGKHQENSIPQFILTKGIGQGQKVVMTGDCQLLRHTSLRLVEMKS